MSDSRVIAYTEAGFRRGKGSRWAFWLRSRGERVVSSGNCPNQVTSSVGAKLFAAKEALTASIRRWPGATEIEVHSNCTQTLKSLARGSKIVCNSACREIQEDVLALIANAGVEIRTVYEDDKARPQDVRSSLNKRVSNYSKDESKPPAQTIDDIRKTSLEYAKGNFVKAKTPVTKDKRGRISTETLVDKSGDAYDKTSAHAFICGKTSVTAAGQPCRHCQTPVVLKSHKKMPSAKKSKSGYYFAYWLKCPNKKCRAIYLLPEAKRYFAH